MFGAARPLIGVIHLPPLPGGADSPGLDAVVEKALADAAAFAAGPVDAVLVENDEDRPLRVEAARETIAVMTRVVHELTLASRVAVGVEILLNDPEASIAIALAAGAAFIRTDYFVDPMERDDFGPMRADAAAILAYRRRLGAESIRVLADVQVKHARMTVERTLGESSALARDEGADAVIVSGSLTGVPPGIEDLQAAKSGAPELPVLIGSGLDAANAAAIFPHSDGAIVGTSVKSGASVDAEKARALCNACRLRR